VGRHFKILVELDNGKTVQLRATPKGELFSRAAIEAMSQDAGTMKALARNRRNFGNGGRAGAVTPGLVKMLGASVIVAGVTYAYDQYVDAGWTSGVDLATKVGLGRALQLAGEEDLLPSTSFTVVTSLRKINVTLAPDDGEYYITASYDTERWSIFFGSYTETTYIITRKDNYRVHYKP
jgi:hypothetical protein